MSYALVKPRGNDIDPRRILLSWSFFDYIIYSVLSWMCYWGTPLPKYPEVLI